MTATISPRTPLERPPRSPGLARQLRDVVVLTRRNLVHIAREPLQLSDVTVQPVLFTLLFVYVFGAGVVLPHGGSYTDFAIAGLLALNLTTSSMGTAVGLSTDLGERRDRPLPHAPDVAARRARRPLARRPADRRALHGDRRRDRPRDRLATGSAASRSTLAGFGDLPLLQLRPLVGLRLPRHRQQGPRVGAGHRASSSCSRSRSSPTPSCRPSTCRRCCARSPTGTP